MFGLADYLKDKLDTIAGENVYVVSKERNVDADYNKHQVIVSALSGAIYEESSTIPYQIDIVTNDLESVMIDFTTLAKNNNNKPFTYIDKTKVENEFKSVTITPFFNTPVVMEKDIEIGSDKYARIVVFATVNEVTQVSNIKSLKINGEKIDFLTASLIYTAELNTNRISGQNMNVSKKKASSCSVSVSMIHKASVFTNKLFSIATGSVDGNTSFSVEVELDNGIKATLIMILGSYTFSNERTKLPTINFGMFLYDTRERVVS